MSSAKKPVCSCGGDAFELAEVRLEVSHIRFESVHDEVLYVQRSYAEGGPVEREAHCLRCKKPYDSQILVGALECLRAEEEGREEESNGEPPTRTNAPSVKAVMAEVIKKTPLVGIPAWRPTCPYCGSNHFIRSETAYEDIEIYCLLDGGVVRGAPEYKGRASDSGEFDEIRCKKCNSLIGDFDFVLREWEEQPMEEEKRAKEKKGRLICQEAKMPPASEKE